MRLEYLEFRMRPSFWQAVFLRPTATTATTGGYVPAATVIQLYQYQLELHPVCAEFSFAGSGAKIRCIGAVHLFQAVGI